MDDENSQAEGTAEAGAIGGAINQFVQQQRPENNLASIQQQANTPHYENIYESIEHYAVANNNAALAVAENLNPSNNNNHNAVPAGVAIAPADQQNNHVVNSNSANVVGENRSHPQQANRTNNLNFQFRNDLYDRINVAGYDVPRSVRSGLGMRRSNLQLNLHAANRAHYANYKSNQNNNNNINSNSIPAFRQGSFDDTESHQYFNMNNGSGSAVRYENIYEQIRDEPIYRNSTTKSNSRLYGRLNVIGHGIGRIERHLSSSCGNIDHYNLGGHYAVLGHSHFGTVGHIRLNTASNVTNNNGLNQNPVSISSASHVKDNGVRNSTSSFFSCLGGENSQSMNNIYRASSASNNNSNGPTNSYLSSSNSNRINTPNLSTSSGGIRNTGAIPKTKLGKIAGLNSNNNYSTSAQNTPKPSAKVTQTTQKSLQNPEHSSTLNRISKSSLQWLLVNKWLPLWMGQGPDCKVIDFNFMFSRNCDGCDYNTTQNYLSNVAQQQGLIKYNGRTSAASRRGCSSTLIRPLPNNLSRLRESESSVNSLRRNVSPFEENNYENVHVHFQNGFEFGKSREKSDYVRPPMVRARSESPTFAQNIRIKKNEYSDPFKNYELNAENNTFKPQKKDINYSRTEKFKVNEGASTSYGALPVAKREKTKNQNNNHNEIVDQKTKQAENADEKSELEEYDDDSDTFDDSSSFKDVPITLIKKKINEETIQNENSALESNESKENLKEDKQPFDAD